MQYLLLSLYEIFMPPQTLTSLSNWLYIVFTVSTAFWRYFFPHMCRVSMEL